MKAQIKDLAEMLDKLSLAKATYKKAMEEFELRNSTITGLISDLNKNVVAKKSEIELLALADYKKNANKKLFGGVKIQERKSLKYDKAKALSFAKEKDMFLILDTKAFEKAATSINIDFIEIVTSLKTTFPAVITWEE